MSYKLTREQLLADLYKAFYKAKKNKGNKSYIKVFEGQLHANLKELRDELYERRYNPQPSFCFIIEYPKKREVFAAHFRDRIVHHLYFEYTHRLFERTFIYDTYSCIEGRGTHFGIRRLEHHIKQETNNHHKEAYILKMDIKGYFMGIDRHILLETVNRTLNKMRYHKVSSKETIKWDDVLDFCFIGYLSETIILLDPTTDCIFCCDRRKWEGLPPSKTLFGKEGRKGLPIGNLTSQLFSNVYLNALDQYVKRNLRVKHYGRYVDDFYIVCKDKKRLHEVIPLISQFLEKELHLEIQKGKTIIRSSKQGTDFLGGFIKPYRTYVSNHSLRRMRRKLSERLSNLCEVCPMPTINSYLGILSHYKSYNIRVGMFCGLKEVYRYGIFNDTMTKMILRI